MNTNQPDYISTLDEYQRAAVLSPTDRPILTVAAAGSGKTTVLTSRVAHLVKALEYGPSTIIVTTFAKAAAEELKKRLTDLIGVYAANKVQASTIHSLCLTTLLPHLIRQRSGNVRLSLQQHYHGPGFDSHTGLYWRRQ